VNSPVTVETRVAAANALTLGASLAATGTIALAVRLLVPRLLGPDAFGELRLAESLAEIVFILLTFGIDIRLRSEAATDPQRVTRYLGGLVALRVATGATVIVLAAVSLLLSGTTPAIVRIFVVAAIAQTLLVLNNSYGALEHAAGDVGWLARTSLAFKIAWAVGLVAVLLNAPNALAIVTVAMVAELARFGWLTRRGIRHHALRLRPRF
jgi:O-antigen/teichoic acid export membrane protein